MIRPSVRQFTLTDAMILVAAVAVGLAGIRAESTVHYHPVTVFRGPVGHGQNVMSSGDQLLFFTPGNKFVLLHGYSMPDWVERVQGLALFLLVAAPFLAALSVAMLMIRLRYPRPTARPLFRQPGLVAQVSVTVALGMNLLFGLLQTLLATLGLAVGLNDLRFDTSLSFLACQVVQPRLWA